MFSNLIILVSMFLRLSLLFYLINKNNSSWRYLCNECVKRKGDISTKQLNSNAHPNPYRNIFIPSTEAWFYPKLKLFNLPICIIRKNHYQTLKNYYKQKRHIFAFEFCFALQFALYVPMSRWKTPAETSSAIEFRQVHFLN